MNGFGLPISKTLKESSSGIIMDSDKAYAALAGIFAGAGISSAVAFHPASSALLYKAFSIKIISATASAIGATAVISAIAFSSVTPSFRQVSVPDAYTGQDVAVTVDMEHSSFLDSLYCIAPDGSIINADSAGSGTYTLDIPENGSYTIVASGNNGKTASYDFTVDCIDKDGPVLGNYSATDSSIVVYFHDAQGSVDYSSIYGEAEDGTRILPSSVDESAGSVTFDLPKEDFTIYVFDTLGNVSANRVTVN